MLIKIVVLYLISTLASSKATASENAINFLMYKKDTLTLIENPLLDLPNDSLRTKLENLTKHCNTIECDKRYQIEWSIIENQLYLTGIYDCCNDLHRHSLLKQLFGERVKDGRIKADWAEGKYNARDKFMFSIYDHMVFKREITFEFKEGFVVDTKIEDNSKARASEYSRSPGKLPEFITQNIRWNNLPDTTGKHVRVFVSFSANEKGEIDSVQILKGSSEVYNLEAIRVIKSIPNWHILYQHGKFKRVIWNLPISFNPTFIQKNDR